MKTTFSRRELYALGEPFGDSATVKKVDGGRIFGMGGGGGGGTTQSTGTTYTTNIPEYARPYTETMLGATQRQLFEGTPTEGGGFDITGFKPYKPYSANPENYVAPFQGLQSTAFEGAKTLGPTAQTGEASNIAQQAAYNALNTQYQPGYFGSQFQAPEAYRAGQFGIMQAQAPELQQYQMGPAERASTGSFTQPGTAAQYMSPYIEQAMAPQLREAQRASDILGTQQAGEAVQRGAFGGSRAGLLEAERQRNLATQMGDIRARGYQSAYEQAQNLYGTEAQRGLQAQLANQQAGLTVGGQNLAAQLGIQQLGAGQNLQAQLANQQAFQQAQAQREASRQFGYGQRMQAAGLGAQYGQAAQQLGEQSRQYGAGLGIQGLQTALSGAGQLGSLGQQEFAQKQGALTTQQQFGALQQAREQQIINQAIQDYANAQQYPLMQLGVMSNMLRGLPMQAATTNQYVAAPNPITQGIGAAGTYASLQNAGVFGRPGGAAGGLPSEFKYAKGGIASIPRYDVGGEVESDLESMKTEELSKQARESSSPIIRRIAQRILRERQMEQNPNPMPQMAGGGIVAFQSGGLNDLRKQLAAATASGDFEAANFYARQVADLEAPPKSSTVEWPVKSGVEVKREDGAAPPTAPRAAPPPTAPARPTITKMSPAEIERLRQNPYAEDRTAPVAPEEPQARATPAAPPVQRAAPRRDVAPAAVPPAPPAGIMAVAPPDRAGEAEAQAAMAAGIKPVEAKPTFTGPFSEARQALYEAQRRAGMSDEEYLAEVKKGKPEDTASAEYRKQIMAERANAEKENERQRQMRLAQFFAKWGSTPGPTIAAGLSALEKSLPEMISDEQSFKKAKRELDKVMFDIDHATRLEELGDRKEARALKEKAADRAKDLQHYLTQAQASERSAQLHGEATVESANIRARAERDTRAESAAGRRQAAENAAEAKIYGQYQAAGRQRDVVERDIAREKEGKQHTADLKFLQTYGSMDLKDLPAGYDKKIDEVKRRVASTEKGWEERLNRARLSEERAYKRYAGEDTTTNTLSPEDKTALDWANKNPNDPRAAKIKERLGR